MFTDQLKRVGIFCGTTAVCAFIALGPTPTASAFVLGSDDTVQVWQDTEIVFDYNLVDCPGSVEEYMSLFDYGIAQWSYIPGSRLRLKRGEPVTTTIKELIATRQTKRNPVIYCLANVQDFHGAEYDRSIFTYGGYGQYYFGSDKQVSSGFVFLNVDPLTKSGPAMKATLEQTGMSGTKQMHHLITHEIGHVLTLGHSGDTASVMNYSGGETLSKDDEDAMRYLYPAAKTLVGCATVGLSANSKPGLGFVNVVLLLLPLFLGLTVFKRKKI